jgi:hypothetical protein
MPNDYPLDAGGGVTKEERWDELIRLVDEEGYVSIPLRPGDKRPAIKWTDPANQLATGEQVLAHAKAQRYCNFGVVQGGGRFVIDFDSVEAYDAAQDWLPKSRFEVKTPRGWHVYFKDGPDGLRNSAGKVAEKVDVRAEGGYVVAPGSEVDSKTYVRSKGRKVGKAPKSVLQRIQGGGKAAERERGRDQGGDVPVGARHDTLVRDAARWRKSGFALKDALDLSRALALRFEKPMGDKERESAVRDIYERYEAGEGPVLEEDLPPLPEISAEVQCADTPPPYVVEGVVYEENITNLLGSAKSGKSFIGGQLALAVATGSPFLGLETAKLKVFYVTMELQIAVVRDRISSIAKQKQWGLPSAQELIGEGRLSIWGITGKTPPPELRLESDAGRKRLAKHIRSIWPSARVMVVLDTLEKCVELQGKNDRAWKELYRDQQAWAKENRFAVVCVDHTHRARQEADASTAAHGNQHKGRGAAVNVKLDAERDKITKEITHWTLEAAGWFGDPVTMPLKRPVDMGVEGVGFVRCEWAEIAKSAERENAFQRVRRALLDAFCERDVWDERELLLLLREVNPREAPRAVKDDTVAGELRGERKLRHALRPKLGRRMRPVRRDLRQSGAEGGKRQGVS